MRKGVKRRVFALLAILVAGVAYILFGALQVQVTNRPFPVVLRMPTTGGLFSGGYVTLRGVDVGRITSLKVQPNGIVAHLAINAKSRIPANAQVTVHDLSAVGEQYVDFVPNTNQGPYLKSHSVVTAGRDQLPIQVPTLLRDSSGLANSIESPQLDELFRTMTAALQGTGPQLRSLLNSTAILSNDLTQTAPAIDDALNYGQVLLNTGIQTNPDLDSSAHSLDQLSQQLQASDGDMRAVLSEAPGATNAMQQVVQADAPDTKALLDSSATMFSAFANNPPAADAMFQQLPLTLEKLLQIASPQGIRFLFHFNDQNTVCTYPNAPIQVPMDTHVLPPVLNRDCPPNNAPDYEQRGADNAPLP